MGLLRAATPDTLRLVELDALTVAYHRRSGITHLLASPAPEILAVLGTEPMTRTDLLARLREAFELGEGSGEALDARLAELHAAGLVSDA